MPYSVRKYTTENWLIKDDLLELLRININWYDSGSWNVYQRFLWKEAEKILPNQKWTEFFRVKYKNRSKYNRNEGRKNKMPKHSVRMVISSHYRRHAKEWSKRNGRQENEMERCEVWNRINCANVCLSGCLCLISNCVKVTLFLRAVEMCACVYLWWRKVGRWRLFITCVDKASFVES